MYAKALVLHTVSKAAKVAIPLISMVAILVYWNYYICISVMKNFD